MLFTTYTLCQKAYNIFYEMNANRMNPCQRCFSTTKTRLFLLSITPPGTLCPDPGCWQQDDDINSRIQ